jgi:hypothetical protein
MFNFDHRIQTQPEWQQEHLVAWLFGSFAVLAMALAAAGEEPASAPAGPRGWRQGRATGSLRRVLPRAVEEFERFQGTVKKAG